MTDREAILPKPIHMMIDAYYIECPHEDCGWFGTYPEYYEHATEALQFHMETEHD